MVLHSQDDARTPNIRLQTSRKTVKNKSGPHDKSLQVKATRKSLVDPTLASRTALSRDRKTSEVAQSSQTVTIKDSAAEVKSATLALSKVRRSLISKAV